MKNFYLVENHLVKRDLSILRDKDVREYQFRLALDRISSVLAIEVSRELKLEEITVSTPLELTTGFRFKDEIVLMPVLRAGLAMVNSFLNFFPEGKVGHIGLQRNEETLQPVDYYFKTPNNVSTAKILVLDPMLATGGSASAAIGFLKERGARDCIFVCLIAAPEGVSKLNGEHPDIKIFCAGLDRELNGKGYILPGLGDAGDRTFGTF